MIVNEIFYSLQAEGGLAGVPSVFVRLAGCPLRCRWCDTKYAWSESEGTEYTAEQVKDKIESYPAKHLIITGGEPMTKPGLSELLEVLDSENLHITIETSGIKFVPDLPCDLMSISPKLSNSTPAEPDLALAHEKMRFDLPALQRLIDNYRYQLKFVVDGPDDIDQIKECLTNLENVNRGNAYLMPQAERLDEYLAKSKMTAKLCKQTGLRFSPRLQVLLWDNERGR
ncbi:MAG: radical SAM protein [Planctomycetota bacterium]|nr:MAG: radical SAM protein [Planctomycetota bacterium]